MQATLGDPATLTSLTTYFRRACRGELPTIAAATFSSARMVALNKSRPGVRPIGVPLVLRRMAGRLFAVRFRDHWAARLTGCGGRVVNFAVGRKSGAQAKAVACQELLAILRMERHSWTSWQPSDTYPAQPSLKASRPSRERRARFSRCPCPPRTTLPRARPLVGGAGRTAAAARRAGIP